MRAAVEADLRWLGWENGGRCAGKGRDVRLRGERTMQATVEAAFRWLGWGIGGQCAGKGRDVRLIGGKALRRSGWRTSGKGQRSGKRGRVSLGRLSGSAVSGHGVCARFIFDVRKSGNAELCARIGTGCRFGCALRVRGERTMQAAVEATMLGGKTLTAPLARRKNDASGG